VRWRHRDRSLFLWLLVAAALLVLVVNPIARLLWVSLQGPHGLTLANYVTAFSRWRYVEALVNSLILGLSVGALCTLFGVPMAWAVSRTDMAGKTLVWIAVLGTFIVPNYVSAVSWIVLAGPNGG